MEYTRLIPHDNKYPEFNWTERGRIYELRRYRCELTINELSDIFKLSERQCKTFVNKLLKFNVIKEV